MKIPLHDILEDLLGIKEISSQEELDALIAALKSLGNVEIDFSKYAQPPQT